jgi:hypothetical protein
MAQLKLSTSNSTVVPHHHQPPNQGGLMSVFDFNDSYIQNPTVHGAAGCRLQGDIDAACSLLLGCMIIEL